MSEDYAAADRVFMEVFGREYRTGHPRPMLAALHAALLHQAAKPAPIPSPGRLDPNAMTGEETEAAIQELVATRYPYEVDNALMRLQMGNRDLAIVVGAALARAETKGETAGAEKEKAAMRKRLGL